MQRRGVFALLHRYAVPLALLLVIGLMLWLAWFIPRSIAWRFTFSRFVHENPVFVIALLISHYTYDIFGALAGWLGRTEHCAWHDHVAKANVNASLYRVFLFDVLANPFYNRLPNSA
jgi:hypothetical protein